MFQWTGWFVIQSTVLFQWTCCFGSFNWAEWFEVFQWGGLGCLNRLVCLILFQWTG